MTDPITLQALLTARAKTMRCETCRFLDYQGEGETDIGQCRRHAPRPEAEDVMGDAPTHWPYVRAADWCGDHAEPALDEELEKLCVDPMKRVCTVCGEYTEMACADCAIDSAGKKTVYVCVDPRCRDTHEAAHDK